MFGFENHIIFGGVILQYGVAGLGITIVSVYRKERFLVPITRELNGGRRTVNCYPKYYFFLIA
ncbi:MAG: hypothetical protein RR990_05660 [Lachnospiraceae bacterium]